MLPWLDKPGARIDALYALAHIAQREGYPKKANGYSLRAMKEVLTSYGQFSGERLAPAWSSRTHKVFDQAFLMALEQGTHPTSLLLIAAQHLSASIP